MVEATGPGDAARHLQRLAASWQLLADLSFSDLLMLTPSGPAGRFEIAAQVRPTTGQTAYPMDLVGSFVDETLRPLLSGAWEQGEIFEGDALLLGSDEPARVEYIPVSTGEQVVAVVLRETRPAIGRRIGELEHQYLALFDRFAHMITEGSFPFRHDDDELEDAPRVGDGVVVLDADLRVRFASPNSVSAMHRMGIHSYAVGLGLGALGFDAHAGELALVKRAPVIEEIEHPEVSLLVRAIPFLEGDEVAGAVMLLRDVTDLRRRDRMLLSKDATIREIHHRVKNNLQTIAALLRLQGRRLATSEARAALEESERRIRAIAIVHDTLSRGVADVVSLDDILQPLVQSVQEAVAGPEVHIRFEVSGDAGLVPGDVATPLAVVLNELMQNAVDHAFPSDGRKAGTVRVGVARHAGRLEVDVVDDGVGLPPGFRAEASPGLGLSIVEALVTTELGGSMELHGGHGTRVHLVVPLPVQLA